MVRTSYFQPTTEETFQAQVGPQWGISDLVGAILRTDSDRGHPAAEVIRDDGASLSLGTDGDYAVLVWVDPDGTSFSSVAPTPRPVFVYDYYGSWTEAPPEAQVALQDAVRAMEQFARSGTPETAAVTFEAD